MVTQYYEYGQQDKKYDVKYCPSQQINTDKKALKLSENMSKTVGTINSTNFHNAIKHGELRLAK